MTTKQKRRIILIVATIVAVLVPFLITGTAIAYYGVNMPFMDEWETVRLLDKLDHGQLGIADLWQQHNEHRIFFINLITVTIGWVTHWHLGVQMMLGLACMLGVAALLTLYVWPDVQKRPALIGAVLVLSALIFSLGQWENWIRGFQLQWFLCLVGGVATLYCLDERATWSSFRVRFGLAIAACVVSSYSLGSGIFFWAAGMIPLLAARRPRVFVGGWMAAAVICLAVYFLGYTFLESMSVDVTLVQQMQFFLAYLGNVFTVYPETAVAFGGILLLVSVLALWYALFVRRQTWSALALPLGLMVFVLASALVTTHSRTTITGPIGATNSKYATVSTLLVVALVLLFIRVYKPKHVGGPALLIIIVTPLLIGVSLHGLGQMRAMQATLRAVSTCMHAPNPSQECLAAAHPSPGKVAENLVILKRLHLGGF